VYYLGGLVGGTWNILFGWGGILSFRILAVITLVLTVYFTCLSLGKLIKPIVIPVATLFVLLMNNIGIVVFFHNYLTALLVSISVYLLLKGLNERRFMPLFWAAFFCGMNIFTRLPNITMLALGVLLFINYYYEKDTRQLWKNILSCLAGVFTGVVFVLLLMFLFGHWENFLHSIDAVISIGTSADSSHNLPLLFSVYLNSYKGIYNKMALFVFTVFLSVIMYNRFKQKWLKIPILFFFTGVIIYYLHAFINEHYYGIILFPLLVSCYVDRKNKPITLLNVVSLIVLFFLPWGSDGGIWNMGGACVWPATFVSILHCYRFIRYKMQKGNQSYCIFTFVFCSLYALYGLHTVSRQAYFDQGSRWEKLFKADNEKFTVFTSEEKAKIIDELLSELEKYVKKDDYLLCFESLPMIHYLTETKPYMGNPWVWCYSSESFKKNLDMATAHISLPIVLRQKCQPIGGCWTKQSPMDLPYYRSEILDKYLYKQSVHDYFEKFLKDNRYQIVWENDLFSIYAITQ
jgi:hypothetical protein